MASQRIIVTISSDDKVWLNSYSKANNISTAEAVRQGIRKLRQATRNDTYKTLLDATKCIWRREDGLAFQKRIRSEWTDR